MTHKIADWLKKSYDFVTTKKQHQIYPSTGKFLRYDIIGFLFYRESCLPVFLRMSRYVNSFLFPFCEYLNALQSLKKRTYSSHKKYGVMKYFPLAGK